MKNYDPNAAHLENTYDHPDMTDGMAGHPSPPMQRAHNRFRRAHDRGVQERAFGAVLRPPKK